MNKLEQRDKLALIPFFQSYQTENPVVQYKNQMGSRNWTTIKEFDQSLFTKHFNHEINLALKGKKETDWLCIDIDTRGRGDLKIVGKLLNLFKNSSFPFRSSNSGGVHFYIFLNDFENTEKARKTLKDFLKLNGLESGRDYDKIFPNGNALRVPFGKGNRPLQADDWLSGYSKEKQIDFFNNWFNSELQRLDIEKLEIVSIEPQKTVKKRTATPQITHGNSAFWTDRYLGIDNLLKHGLRRFGTRFDATKRLAFYWITIQGKTKLEAERIITEWLVGKNNRNSNCFNNNTQKAINDVSAVIRNYDETLFNKSETTKETLIKPEHYIGAENLAGSDPDARIFFKEIVKLAWKFGAMENGSLNVTLAYNVFSIVSGFKDRNKISRYLQIAKERGLIKRKRTHEIGLHGTIYELLIGNLEVASKRPRKPDLATIENLRTIVSIYGVKNTAEAFGKHRKTIGRAMLSNQIPKSLKQQRDIFHTLLLNLFFFSFFYDKNSVLSDNNDNILNITGVSNAEKQQRTVSTRSQWKPSREKKGIEVNSRGFTRNWQRNERGNRTHAP